MDSKTEISHHIHLAKHEGYEIMRPSKFFQQYGCHVLTVLQMLKYGISVAGVLVPAISHLVQAQAIDQAVTFLGQLKDNIEPEMDIAIDFIDRTIDEFDKQMENKEALEGADLRKLDTFLKANDGKKVLGNLYRTVTDEGHVKWFCIDHYRENYKESMAKEFRRLLNVLGGSFNESNGRVEVKLRSKASAQHFFSALGKVRSVYELDITFNWACTASDLEEQEAALKISRVSILQLDLLYFQSSLGTKLLSTSVQYRVLFRITELPNMKIIHIILPKEFIMYVSLQPMAPSHLHKLSFDVVAGSIGEKELGKL